MNKQIKFYEELEYTINDCWDALPDTVKEALNKVYEKHEPFVKENDEENEK